MHLRTRVLESLPPRNDSAASKFSFNKPTDRLLTMTDLFLVSLIFVCF